jgi:hypothetical protein
VSDQANPRHGRYNVVATYADAAAARAAMTALEQKGLEANRIALRGSAPARAAGPKDGGRLRTQDMRATSNVARRVIVGAVVGAVIAFVVLLAAWSLLDVDLPFSAVLVVALIGGGTAGAFVGGFLAGASKLPVKGEEWEDTFDPEAQGAGETSVAVHTDDEAELRLAVSALEGTHPARLERFGPDGRPVGS